MPRVLAFGRWLKQRRKALELTQAAVARRAGCAPVTVRRFEAGRRRPSRELAERLADVLDLGPEDRAAFIQAARTTTRPPSSTLAQIPDSGPPPAPPPRWRHLPSPVTPLIGRAGEVAAACSLLQRDDVRLLTLVGPPGIGKTRLSLQVAADLQQHFADGVCFVALAPIGDPALVASTIAQALEIKEAAGQPLARRLSAYLRDKRLLLVLDNFEQVVDAGPLVGEMLQAAPAIKVLVTSRMPLHVYGEHEYLVPPLALPDLQRLPLVKQVAEFEAIRLFVARAQAVKADFVLTPENARTAVEICTRLDGLPLAIELAAARIKFLTPEALLARLTNRLQFLTGGARDHVARQQTLQNAIDWSYNLLDAAEQTLFRRLGVFVGGWTIEAAEQVTGNRLQGTGDRLQGIGETEPGSAHLPVPIQNTLDLLQSLVDKSLVMQSSNPPSSLIQNRVPAGRSQIPNSEEPRFTMLETIREYARERLVTSGEAETIHRQHAGYFLAFAERMEPEMEGPQPAVWLAQLEAEHDNLRAALQWALDRGEAEQALRLAGALGPFWHVYGYLGEGRAWLEQALVAGDGTSAVARARALYAAGLLAYKQGDYPRAINLYEQSCALRREIADTGGLARSLHGCGWVVLDQGDAAQAASLFEESLGLRRALRDKRGMADALNALGWVARAQGNYRRATMLWQESLALHREVGYTLGVAETVHDLGFAEHAQGNDERAVELLEEGLALHRELHYKQGIARALNCLGEVARSEGDDRRAEALYYESLRLHQEMGNEVGIAFVLHNLGYIALHHGEVLQAKELFTESLARQVELEGKEGMVLGLAGLAAVAALKGQPLRAARLLGVVESLHPVMDPADRLEIERTVILVRNQLGEQASAAASMEGKTMTLEQAISYALEAELIFEPDPLAGSLSALPSPPPRSTDRARLTDREVEVLRLVAEGLSDKEVAKRLIVSPRTINTHLQSIYGKLGVSSRTAATRYALEHQLV